MKDVIYGNVTSFERLARLAVGGVLISAGLNPEIDAHWLSLLSVYPVITAIMAWDPLYAFVDQVKSRLFPSKVSLKYSPA